MTPYFNKMQKKLDKVRTSMQTRLNQLEEKEKPEEDKQVISYNQEIKKLGGKIIIRLEHENISREKHEAAEGCFSLFKSRR